LIHRGEERIFYRRGRGEDEEEKSRGEDKRVDFEES
jgi:hypothetical protein